MTPIYQTSLSQALPLGATALWDSWVSIKSSSPRLLWWKMAKCRRWQVVTMVALGSLPQVTKGINNIKCQNKQMPSRTLCGWEHHGGKPLMEPVLPTLTKRPKTCTATLDPGPEEGRPGPSFCEHLKPHQMIAFQQHGTLFLKGQKSVSTAVNRRDMDLDLG